jgi:hypothetical protein
MIKWVHSNSKAIIIRERKEPTRDIAEVNTILALKMKGDSQGIVAVLEPGKGIHPFQYLDFRPLRHILDF